MKAIQLTALISIMGAGILQATPDPTHEVHEEFYRASEDRIIIKRTEFINPGSHYQSQTKVWLDEYDRSEPVASKVKSTLLLDQKATRDAGFSGPGRFMPVKYETNAKDSSILLGDLLEQNPIGHLSRCTDRMLKDITQRVGEGIFYKHPLSAREIMIYSFDNLNDKFSYESGKGFEHDISNVYYDGHSIYLELDHGELEKSLIMVSSNLSRRIFDQWNLKEQYLVEGRYSTEKEVIDRKKELTQKALDWRIENRKHLPFTPQIWVEQKDDDHIVYTLVDWNGDYLLRRGKVDEVEEALGIKLTSSSGANFLEIFYPHTSSTE